MPNTHYLYPGGLFIDPQRHLVTTVLGSCVAVCLWDPLRAVGGLNHFLLPLWNGEGLPTPRYGSVAIPRLVEGLADLGCRRGDLQAKVFGGAAMWQGSEGILAIGERNVALARRLLTDLAIPVVAGDCGGACGRKIVFDTGSGEVLLRRTRGHRQPSAA